VIERNEDGECLSQALSALVGLSNGEVEPSQVGEGDSVPSLEFSVTQECNGLPVVVDGVVVPPVFAVRLAESAQRRCLAIGVSGLFKDCCCPLVAVDGAVEFSDPR
jgi:hypothetical protein